MADFWPEQDALASPGRPDAAAAALCALCGAKAAERWLVCPCGARTHVECLARHYLQARRAPRPALYVKLQHHWLSSFLPCLPVLRAYAM